MAATPCLGCRRIGYWHRVRCPTCSHAADTARGTATQRGYTTKGHRAFRAAVLTRDPVCVLCLATLATIADHYPISRRDLLAAGLDPNEPEQGRGHCKRCHDRETARLQPGGWNAR